MPAAAPPHRSPPSPGPPLSCVHARRGQCAAPAVAHPSNRSWPLVPPSGRSPPQQQRAVLRGSGRGTRSRRWAARRRGEKAPASHKREVPEAASVPRGRRRLNGRQGENGFGLCVQGLLRARRDPLAPGKPGRLRGAPYSPSPPGQQWLAAAPVCSQRIVALWDTAMETGSAPI